MYRVIKEAGNNQNLFLENTDTKAQLNLGRVSVEILHILEKDGHSFGGSDIQYKDAWNLTVSDSTKAELERKAYKISRPVKSDKTATVVPTPEPKKVNKNIDAMDVLLGLASYN